MRVHAVGLPHADPTRAWEHCAYASKLRRLGAMLAPYGHELLLYVGERNEGVCAEHIPIVGARERDRWFGGEWDREKVFDRWEPSDPCWTEMADLAIAAIRARWDPGDIIGITMGLCQKPIADAFPNAVIAELGCGYEGILPNSHVAFESHAWRHYVYGRNNIADGRFYDAVIPNAFDPADYTAYAERDDYVLFLGRLTERKGLRIVAEVAKHCRVVTAGQGEPLDGIEHRGLVTGEAKRELLGRARAVLIPTTYVEPFGGVAVEAMFSGAPAITTSFGAFSETVTDGVTGYRCDTLADFLAVLEVTDDFEPAIIRAAAEARFSLDAVAPQYDRWLRNLGTLYADGWYTAG